MLETVILDIVRKFSLSAPYCNFKFHIIRNSFSHFSKVYIRKIGEKAYWTHWQLWGRTPILFKFLWRKVFYYNGLHDNIRHQHPCAEFSSGTIHRRFLFGTWVFPILGRCLIRIQFLQRGLQRAGHRLNSTERYYRRLNCTKFLLLLNYIRKEKND